MLVWSKYLEELGYKKSDFLFDKKAKEDSRYALDKTTGVIEAQTWNLETTIILELYVYLRCFQDNFMDFGLPMRFTEEAGVKNGEKKYHKIIQDIIDGLKARLEVYELAPVNFEDYEAFDKARNELNDKFEKGWKLLGENIDCLWW